MSTTQSATGKIGVSGQDKVSVIRSALDRFPRALLEVAKVSEYGCWKYGVPLGDRDFLRSPTIIEDCTDALGRHKIAEVLEGPVNARDGDMLHAAQLAWNALARLEAMLDRGIVKPARRWDITTPRPNTIAGQIAAPTRNDEQEGEPVVNVRYEP